MSDPLTRRTRRRTVVAGTGLAVAVTAAVLVARAGGDQDLAAITTVLLVVGGIVLVGTVALGHTNQRDLAATAWSLVPLAAWLPGRPLAPGVGPLGWMVLVLGAAGACYLFGRVLAGPDLPRPAHGRPPPDAVRLPLADGERVLWSRSISSRPALAMALLLGAGAGMQFAAAATGSPPNLVAGGVMAVAAVAAVLRCWARIRVGADGVRIEQPLLRRALVEAPIGEVRAARAGPLDPGRFGPLQFGVLRGDGVTGYRATRRGDALTLELTGDRRFVVTVPDAVTAAGLVNAELDRQRAPGDPAC